MEKGYQVFVLIQLAITKGVINVDTEYDLQWEQGLILYAKFTDSTFNVTNDAYECILNFLDSELTQEFNFYVDAVEINRYKYTVKALSLEDAKRKIGIRFKEHPIPYANPSPLDIGTGICGYDREAAWETISIRDITVQ